MDYFPIFMSLRGQPCLVVGGGVVAMRKARALVRSGAALRVVAPVIDQGLRQLAEDSGGEVLQREFEAADLQNVRLVIAATDSEPVNEWVSRAAQQLGLPVNVVDQPALSSFIMPAVVDRSPVVIAVSSAGRAPVLTRLLKARIETLVPAAWGELAELVGRYRGRVRQRFASSRERNRFWTDTLQGVVADLVFAGQHQQAEQVLNELLDNPQQQAGVVYLIGAGPGDPDLLTFRALRLMQRADVVVYDRLVSPQILDMVRKDAQMIYAGKQRADHALPQPQINQLLADQANEGKRVVRLKGGDPFIFGRGGEEIALLADAGIPFQVVPGITAASGCSAYAGIPLTHRDHAQMVVFVTGHLKNNSVNVDVKTVARLPATLVIYMGLVGLAEICQQLVDHGRDRDTPAALIESGTTANQRVISASLETLAEVVSREKVKAPTLVIVGDVVALRDQLKWFNSSIEQT